MRGGVIAAAALALLGFAETASAAKLQVELDSAFTWMDVPVTLAVAVSDPERGLSAPELPAVDGVRVRGPFGPSQQTSIVNGKMSSSLKYAFELNPTRPGSFRLGPVRMKRSGQGDLESGPIELRVYVRPKAIGVSMGATATPSQGPVGATFRLVYTVYYFGEPAGGDDDLPSIFRQGNSLGLVGLDLPILSQSSIRVVPARPSQSEGVHSLRYGRQDPVELFLRQGFAEKDGAGYRTIEVAFDVTPLGEGPVELGGAGVALQLKTGKVTTQRGLFGPERVAEVKRFEARCPATTYKVRPLPEEGRPPGFTGAVGKFQVAVTASPTEVDEGAPIALEIRVSGAGLIADLKPAAWTEIEALTNSFNVSSDVDAGQVEGDAKVFRQIVRPRSESVTSIPPIPFPYFNPESDRYEVARSEAIPIRVRSVKMVTPEDAIRSPQAGAPQATPRAKAAAAPALATGAGIGANFTELGSARPPLDPRDEVFAPPFLAGLVAPPALFAAFALALRLRHRDPRERRRAHALARALSSLSHATDERSLTVACESYFRERLGLPEGELTPRDVRAALLHRGASESVSDSAAEVLERVHASRFGGDSLSPSAIAEEASRVFREVDRCAGA
jgi:hypothetical protein